MTLQSHMFKAFCWKRWGKS